MSVSAVAGGVLARARLVEMLTWSGIESTTDAGAFFPQPLGVLVGLPTLVGRTQGGRTFTIPVLVVSGDPFTVAAAADRALALADDVALALAVANYRPSSWSSSRSAQPLDAIELDVIVTVLEQEASP